MSNSADPGIPETTLKTVKCNVCHGSGTVEIDGWETDCVECEGFGDFEIEVPNPGWIA